MADHDPTTLIPWVRTRLSAMVEEAGGRIYHFALPDGTVQWTNGEGWTDGFWVAMLLLVGWWTDDNRMVAAARQLERVFQDRLETGRPLDHDAGFLYALSSVLPYRLYGDTFARDRALLAADRLYARYHPVGAFIPAWNPHPAAPPEEQARLRGRVIIDGMMNLALLCFAFDETRDPRYAEAAHGHARTTRRHLIRADGSTFHTFDFDPDDGRPLQGGTHQGLRPDSTWARGQAWALYGFSLMYANTGDPAYAEAAQAVLQYWLAHVPSDGVPRWDFMAPVGDPVDTSAALIALAGMMELLDLDVLPASLRSETRAAAERTWETVAGRYRRTNGMGLVTNGVSHFPRQQGVAASLVYGDYFFVEVLLRRAGLQVLPWRRPRRAEAAIPKGARV